MTARSESFIFKALGSFVILVGLGISVLAGWVVWEEWVHLHRWPRTSAVLAEKDGAALTFRYLAYGRLYTGWAHVWWGDDQQVATTTWTPGTVHTISFDPEDPNYIHLVEPDDRPVRLAIGAGVGVLFLICGGIVVYRWSYHEYPIQGEP